MNSPSTDRRFGLNPGLGIKAPCRAATTAAITLNGEQTVDGVALVADDRCVVKDQADDTENGIYKVATGDWVRDADANGNRDLVGGTIVLTTEGTVGAGGAWKLNGSGTITVDTDSITFGDLNVLSTSTRTYNYATVAAMVASTSLNVGDTVTVEDYGTDYGSGTLFFKVVAAGTGTADGGEYIDLDTHQAKQNFPYAITVDMWGASNAVTDNTPPIQAAIDFVQATDSTRHGQLWLTNHTYGIASEITFKDHSDASTRFPFTLAGLGASREGSASIIKCNSGYSDDAMFRFIDTSATGSNAYYNFRDFELNGNESLTTCNRGFDGRISGTAWRFEGMQMHNFDDVCMELDDTATIHVSNCRFRDAVTGIRSEGHGRVNQLTIDKCEFDTFTGPAIHHTGGTAFSLTNSTLQANTGCAVHLSNIQGFNITGNHFEDNGHTGFAISSPSAAGTITAHIILNGVKATTILRGKTSTYTDTVTMTIASPCVVTYTDTDDVWTNGDPVRFSTTDTLPTGVTAALLYYVVNLDAGANTFELSETVGGSSVNTSGTQAGTHTVARYERECSRGTIENNSHSSGPNVNRFVFANAVHGLSIRNNNADPAKCFATYGDTQFSSVRDIEMINNELSPEEPATGDTVGVAAESQLFDIQASFAANNYNDPDGLHTIDFGVRGINYFPQNILEYSQIVDNSQALTIARSAHMQENFLEFKLTAGGSSDVWGVDLDVTNHFANMIGRWMWFGAFVTLSGTTDNNIGLYVEFTVGTGPQNNTVVVTGSTTERQFVSMGFKVPAGETGIQVGFRKLGATGSILVSDPLMMQCGAPYSRAANTMRPASFNNQTIEYSSTKVLTTSEVNNLRATPIALLPAPGAGFITEFISAIVMYNRTGASFTVGGDENILIRYASSTEVSQIIDESAQNFLDSGADAIRFLDKATVAVTTTMESNDNVGLEVVNTGASEYAGGGTSTVTIVTNYRVHATGL